MSKGVQNGCAFSSRSYLMHRSSLYFFFYLKKSQKAPSPFIKVCEGPCISSSMTRGSRKGPLKITFVLTMVLCPKYMSNSTTGLSNPPYYCDHNMTYLIIISSHEYKLYLTLVIKMQGAWKILKPIVPCSHYFTNTCHYQNSKVQTNDQMNSDSWKPVDNDLLSCEPRSMDLVYNVWC